IFLPATMSVVLVGFIWQLLLNPIWGVPQSLLGLFGIDVQVPPWLGNQGSALYAISLISVWSYVGIPMLLSYSALLNISDEILDAARLDGASELVIFVRIKLPMIFPTVGLISILTFVGNMTAFDLVYTIYGALGGPNFSADLLGTFFYRTFFGYQ